MAILSDKTIREYVETGKIGIEPEPRKGQFQPASFDLRIGPELYDMNRKRHVDFSESGEVIVSSKQPYIGSTIDTIELPNDIAAQVTGRSTVGRRGVVVHFTAGLLDPGFRGDVNLEIYNFSSTSQIFDVGERVAQLIFMELDRESTGYSGAYQGQTGVTLPKEEER